jgi:hypothetical protein
MGIIDYQSPLKALVSVKGHPFDRSAFAELFESFEGIQHTLRRSTRESSVLKPGSRCALGCAGIL